MKEKKLLKLLGISLIVGILGFLGSCNLFKKEDDNNEALLLGAAVVQQQAEAAAYEEANNTANAQWFCAFVSKVSSGSNLYYTATLTPLVEQDCNIENVMYNGSSGTMFDEYKTFLRNIINDEGLSNNCTATVNYINNLQPPSGGGNGNPDSLPPTKIIFVSGRSLLDEIGADKTTYSVVSANVYKRVVRLTLVRGVANIDNDSSCVSAIDDKINSIESDLCEFFGGSPLSCIKLFNNNNNTGTKALSASCYYGPNVPPGLIKCLTLNEQF